MPEALDQIQKVGESSPQVNPREIVSADHTRPALDPHTATIWAGEKPLRVVRMDPEFQTVTRLRIAR